MWLARWRFGGKKRLRSRVCQRWRRLRWFLAGYSPVRVVPRIIGAVVEDRNGRLGGFVELTQGRLGFDGFWFGSLEDLGCWRMFWARCLHWSRRRYGLIFRGILFWLRR